MGFNSLFLSKCTSVFLENSVVEVQMGVCVDCRQLLHVSSDGLLWHFLRHGRLLIFTALKGCTAGGWIASLKPESSWNHWYNTDMTALVPASPKCRRLGGSSVVPWLKGCWSSSRASSLHLSRGSGLLFYSPHASSGGGVRLHFVPWHSNPAVKFQIFPYLKGQLQLPLNQDISYSHKLVASGKSWHLAISFSLCSLLGFFCWHCAKVFLFTTEINLLLRLFFWAEKWVCINVLCFSAASKSEWKPFGFCWNFPDYANV